LEFHLFTLNILLNQMTAYTNWSYLYNMAVWCILSVFLCRHPDSDRNL